MHAPTTPFTNRLPRTGQGPHEHRQRAQGVLKAHLCAELYSPSSKKRVCVCVCVCVHICQLKTDGHTCVPSLHRLQVDIPNILHQI